MKTPKKPSQLFEGKDSSLHKAYAGAVTPKKQEKKKVNPLAPVHITKDIWFYRVGKHLEFVVYVGRECAMFNVPLRKINP